MSYKISDRLNLINRFTQQENLPFSFNKQNYCKGLLLLLAVSVVLASCANPFVMPVGALPSYHVLVKDRNPAIWDSNHAHVREFRHYYNRNGTVKRALLQGQKYLPKIMLEFRRHGLPEELAYLPMLESSFLLDADSGSALGMWQFTAQTAKHMGLSVSQSNDERLNWKKSTKAAARYLVELGTKFNYRWELALAAYNGGPNYLKKQINNQHTSQFFSLKLRKETADYVPKFIAMLQIAKKKYPDLYQVSKERFKLVSR